LDQIEDGLSGLEDKTDVLGHTVGDREKKIKKYKYVRPQVHHKKPNLHIMGIEEEVQSKGVKNIFNKIIVENFQTLEKEMIIQL
jgi:hypothetical protein